ncbi:MAG: nuclear transport factor 2 family protein [Flavobacteriales bacterium]|nr:nuclear transport factor 2 family protein [Flavobacteriales bacterium]
MKFFVFLLFLIPTTLLFSQDKQVKSIDKTIDQWHSDAAKSNYEDYFGLMDNNAIYIGTDKSELWKKEEFESFAKPYFDSGKTWDFKTISRNIYFSKDKKVAWFDELLDTWMGICRSSGVLEYEETQWKLKHYHLSVTIDNDKIGRFIELSK